MSPIPGDRFAFTGREWNSTVGLQFNRARYLDSTTGRWSQQDPIHFAARDPNLYRYVGNFPSQLSDATGLIAFLPGDGDPSVGYVDGATRDDAMRVQQVLDQLKKNEEFKKLQIGNVLHQTYQVSGKDVGRLGECVPSSTGETIVTIYINHMEFKELKEREARRLIADVLTHETIHALIAYLTAELAFQAFGFAHMPNLDNTAITQWGTVQQHMNANHNERISNALAEFRQRYATNYMDINLEAQQHIQRVLRQYDEMQANQH